MKTLSSTLNSLILIFIFPSATKIVGFHVDIKKFKCFLFQSGHWNIVLWSMGFSMISDEQLDNFVECFMMSDQSTGWKRETTGHADPGDSRISWAVVRHPHTFIPMITSHPWWPLKPLSCWGEHISDNATVLLLVEHLNEKKKQCQYSFSHCFQSTLLKIKD